MVPRVTTHLSEIELLMTGPYFLFYGQSILQQINWKTCQKLEARVNAGNTADNLITKPLQ